VRDSVAARAWLSFAGFDLEDQDRPIPFLGGRSSDHLFGRGLDPLEGVAIQRLLDREELAGPGVRGLLGEGERDESQDVAGQESQRQRGNAPE
jgi:hypothetical protein